LRDSDLAGGQNKTILFPALLAQGGSFTRTNLFPENEEGVIRIAVDNPFGIL